MTQLENPYETAGIPEIGAPPKTSGLAITSILSAAVGCLPCCPFIGSLLGIVLGGVAVASIKRDPARRGTGLAVGGIVIGIIGLILWVIFGWWIGQKSFELSRFLQDGPPAAITAAAQDDYDGFRSYCYGDAATASDEEVRAFIDALESRYGEFQSAVWSVQQPKPGEPVAPIDYVLNFENKSVTAVVDVIIMDETVQASSFQDVLDAMLIYKIIAIRVTDPETGDVIEFDP